LDEEEMPEIAAPAAMGAPVMYDRAPEVVANTLAEQLATEPVILATGKFDMRKLSIIDERDIPFLIYAKIRGRKTRVWKEIYEDFLALKISIGGRGRRDIIRMQGVARGGLPYEFPEEEKPGFFARLLGKKGKVSEI